MLEDGSTDQEFWATGLRSCSSGLSVLHAKTVEESLSIYRKRKIDCVVLDLDLGNSSGFELLGSLVPDPKHPNVAVVILTHLTNRYLHDLALSQGAKACLVKQWTSPQELIKSIENAVTAIGNRASIAD